MDQQVAQRSASSRIVRYVVRGIVGLIALVIVAVGISAAYNAWAFHHARAAAGIAGKLYMVNGKNMHIYCTGQGSPTIVLEDGLGNNWTIWAKVQPVLSRDTQVCSYDRAGFGWSDPRPGVRDSKAIAAELHGLLTQAGITGPIILMGHSIAGIHMREYEAQYPENVKGIVFIDGSTPLQDQRFPAAAREAEKQYFSKLGWYKFLTFIGVPRVLGQCSRVEPGFEAYAAWIKADSCTVRQINAAQAEVAGVQPSGEETALLGPFGDLPILIFSQDPDKPMAMPGVSDATSREVSSVWNGMQEDVKKLSTRSRRIIAKGSGHYVQVERADLVNTNVENFLQVVRGQAQPLEPWGSTVRQ
jgi:pimeloyl-ACP methyl ester carboxylesterase